MRVGSARFPENAGDHVIEVVVGVGIIVSFREPIDENAGIRRFDRHLGIGAVVVRNGEEDVPQVSVRTASVERVAAVFPVLVQEMVPIHRMHLDFAQEATSGFAEAKEKQCGRCCDGRINPILDAREDGDKHAREENDHFQRGDQPELIDRVGRRDQIQHRVDDDGRKGRVRDVEEHRGERVNGQQDHQSRDHPGERGSYPGLGFDGGARERTGGGIGTEERAQ